MDDGNNDILAMSEILLSKKMIVRGQGNISKPIFGNFLRQATEESICQLGSLYLYALGEHTNANQLARCVSASSRLDRLWTVITDSD